MLNEKVFIPFFMALMLVSLGVCATYNSIAPEWAQIGAESSEATTDDVTGRWGVYLVESVKLVLIKKFLNKKYPPPCGYFFV